MKKQKNQCRYLRVSQDVAQLPKNEHLAGLIGAKGESANAIC